MNIRIVLTFRPDEHRSAYDVLVDDMLMGEVRKEPHVGPAHIGVPRAVTRYRWHHDDCGNWHRTRRQAVACLLRDRGHRLAAMEVLDPLPADGILYEVLRPDYTSTREHNDCAVRALAFVTDVPYWQVYDALCRYAEPHRKAGSGWWPSQSRAALGDLGFYEARVRTPRPPVTVAAFQRAHQRGRYLLSSRDHVVGLVDGNRNCGGRYRVRNAHQIKRRN